MKRCTTFLTVVVVLACAVTAVSHPRYDNTFMKDFIMDAPWRVVDASTPIPLTIILKDCDTDDVRELHWIRCWDVTSGEVILWDHDFGDERIGDDASESNYWTYITTVTEGHASLPDGTLLTPANLGHSAGDDIDLKVSIYYKDDWFNYTETRYLRVRVGHGAYPWPEDWYGGDVHYHTMYTNNIAEFGAPIPAVAMTAEALGLHWLTATDHSCDLDETGDGSFSYATTHWEYTIQDQYGSSTVYRDVFGFGSMWGSLGDDIAGLDSPSLRLFRGVELNSSSVDADSYEKTLHSLFYNANYVSSPLSGGPGEAPVTPTLPAALSQLEGSGFAYAAHPVSELSSLVNGALWGNEDTTMALGYEPFRGLQSFNTRATRYSGDANNPWPDFDSGTLPSNPHPGELLTGVAQWDEYLRANLDPVRKLFLAGGSDAHGDFNYGTYLDGLSSSANNNAIGKVQTVVHVPGGYSPGDLPPMTDILAAYRAGRSVVTDGPFGEIGVDWNGDGDFYDVGDVMIGDDTSGPSAATLPMTVRWASNVDFGPVTSVKLLVGDGSSTSTILTLDPSAVGEDWSGERTVELGELGYSGARYFRAEALTDRGDDTFRAYSNPIWVTFDGTSVDGDDEVGGLRMVLARNPFIGEVAVELSMPVGGDVRLGVYDVAGRRVRTLFGGWMDAGSGAVAWDGRDEIGREVGAGVYLFRLEASGRTVTETGVLLK